MGKFATYESAIPYIKKAEGGLSRAVSDSASKNPSPYIHNGITGWHTNRGITFSTFKALAPIAGYQVNQNNFIEMPDSIWLSIYKTGFWDAMKGGLYENQAIANTVVDFAWGSGTTTATKQLIKFLNAKNIQADGVNTIAEGFNKLVKKEGAEKVFSDLINYRKSFFTSLNQLANINGWFSRMDTLKMEGLQIIASTGKSVKKNPLGVAFLILGSVGLLYTIVNRKTILA